MICRYKKASDLRDDAKGFLNGKYGRAVAVLLLYIGIFYALSIVTDGVQTVVIKIMASAGYTSLTAAVIKDAIFYLVSAVISVFMELFVIGMSLFFLKAGCNTMPAVSDMFMGLREHFGKNIAAAFMVKGIELLILMPYTLLYDYYLEGGSQIFLFVSLGAGIAGLVGVVIIWLNFRMTYYILFDFPDYTAGQALKASVRKMKGNKWRLLKLELSFIPYYLLAVLTFGIGLFWVIPLAHEARAQFYLDLMNPKKISGEWERTQ